jgi:hypothetical protein
MILEAAPTELFTLKFSPFHLVDAAGDDAGLATWEQVGESLSASPEGWIEVEGSPDCYVDGNEGEMRAAYDAWLNS